MLLLSFPNCLDGFDYPTPRILRIIKNVKKGGYTPSPLLTMFLILLFNISVYQIEVVSNEVYIEVLDLRIYEILIAAQLERY